MFLLIAQTSMKPCVGIWSLWRQDSEVEMYSFVMVTFVLVEQVVSCCTVWQVYRHKMRQQECPVCLFNKCGSFFFDSCPQLLFCNESILHTHMCLMLALLVMNLLSSVLLLCYTSSQQPHKSQYIAHMHILNHDSALSISASGKQHDCWLLLEVYYKCKLHDTYL